MGSSNINRIHSSIRAKNAANKRVAYLKKAMPYMGQLWYPAGVKDELANAGPFLIAHPWRGVLHTTEGDSYAGARQAYISNRSAPHFTISFEGGGIQVRQHVPINRAARSLRNLSGGVETNRIRCIQIEIVRRAASIGSLGGESLDGLGRLMRWVEANTTIQPRGPGRPFATAYGQHQLRFTQDEWNKFNGWCGHCHVPENSHWDPGAINIEHLLNVGAGGTAPMFDPPIPIQMVDSRNDPDNGGTWVLDSNGGVITTGTARFWGTPFGKPYWGERKAARIMTGPEAAEFLHAPQYAGYKYVVISTASEGYGYPE